MSREEIEKKYNEALLFLIEDNGNDSEKTIESEDAIVAYLAVQRWLDFADRVSNGELVSRFLDNSEWDTLVNEARDLVKYEKNKGNSTYNVIK